MNCPYCAKAMTEGKLIADGISGILFLGKGESMIAVNFEQKKKQTVAKTRFLRRPQKTAYRCDDCLKIIIDLTEKKLENNK